MKNQLSLLLLLSLNLAFPALGASLPPLQDVRIKNTAGTELATPAAPLRIDPTGTTNQPVTQATSPWVTSRNWTLSNGTDSIAAVQSGTWTVQQGGAPWSVSQSGSWTTGRTWTLSNGTDSIAAVESGTWNITNISGTISLPTGASTSALQTTGNISLASIATNTSPLTLPQASTTSGQLGNLGQAAVTTGPPSYTNGQTDPLSLTTAGALRTDSSGSTQPVSGTVTANQGGAPWLVSQSGTWTVQPGNTPNSTPWLITLNQGGNSATVTGSNALKVDGSAVTQPVSGTVTANAGSGTFAISAASLPLPTGAATSALQTTGNTSIASIDTKTPALGQAAMAASVPVAIASNQSSIPVTQSGTWTAGRTWTLSNGTDSIAAVESGTWSVRAQDGAGNALASSTSAPAGTEQALIVRNIPSGTQAVSAASLPLPTGAATETTLAKIPVAQASTTSGESGPLVQGAVTTAAPSYSTGQTNPLSLTTSGALRVDGSAASQTVIYSDAVPANQTITALDSGTTSLSGANGQVFYFGTPTAGSSASFSVASYNSVTVQANLLGAGGTMVVEVSMDGGSFWFRPNVYQISTQSYGNAFTAPFMGIVNLSGMTNIRVRATVSWAGTATILVRESINDKAMVVTDALPPGTNTIGNISNVSGTISLPTGAATSALQTTGNSSLSSIATNSAALNLSQGSTTSGQTGALTLGAVTTASPSYSTGMTDALSLTTAGALRTDSSATTQPVSGTLAVTQSTTPWTVAGAAASGGSKSGNPVQTGAVFNTTQPTVTTGDVVESQATARGGHIVATGVDPFNVNAVPLDGTKTSYSAAATGITAAATPTDVFTLTGSGTKTIRITRVEVSGTETLSASKNILLVKRSAANTGGTSTTLTATPLDSTNAAATATARSYTANPTGLGALVGNIRAINYDIPAPGAASASPPVVWDFGTRPAQALILRGAAEVVAVNLNSVTSAGNSLSFSIEWTEE